MDFGKHAHQRMEDFTVPITIRLAPYPQVESIVSERRVSNWSIMEKIPPNGVNFSDFICTFTTSDEDLFDFL